MFGPTIIAAAHELVHAATEFDGSRCAAASICYPSCGYG
jgi:hypothetical protein